MSPRYRPRHAAASKSVRRELGAGSVLIIGVIGVVVAALALAGILSAGQSARRQAAAAADLAALAAATHMDRDPATACTTAEAIAVANGAEMRSCVVDGREVEVQVRVLVTGTGSSWLPPQDRRARAGPR